MNVQLNPKLLDVVEFDDPSLGPGAKRRGTVVDVLGEHPGKVLIEIADSQGIPLSFVSKEMDAIKQIWTADSRAAEPVPSEALLHFEKGILFLQNAVFPQAREEFARAFSLDATLRASLLESANVLARKGSLDAAIRVYSLLLDLQPQYDLARQNLSAAYVQRGIARGRTGLLHQAIDDFSSAMMVRPGPEALDLIRKNLAAAHTQLGVRYSVSRQYEQAVAHFLLAFELHPFEITQRNLAIAFVASSAAISENATQVPATDCFRQSIQLGLTYAECLNAFGATLALHGRSSEARLALEAALEADPKNELAQRNLSLFLREQVPAGMFTGILPLPEHELHYAGN
jgi:tetratricopeptide (TPR) repeat protein